MTASEAPAASFRTGTVAVLGRPNSGKSTLVNALVNAKVAIVSSKPQTTRTYLRGILNREDAQVVFVDTPGAHRPETRLNREMVGAIQEALLGVDLFYLVVDASREPDAEDGIAFQFARDSRTEGFLVVNKIDLIRPEQMLPLIDHYRGLWEFGEHVPVSALRRENLALLLDRTLKRLPQGPPLFPQDEFTDQPARFMAAEIVRERIFHETRQEIPYKTAVVIEKYEQAENLVRIHGAILVERPGQKAIILGAKGKMIKRIGTSAREEIENLVGSRVYLELFVKVREDWQEHVAVRRLIDWRQDD